MSSERIKTDYETSPIEKTLEPASKNLPKRTYKKEGKSPKLRSPFLTIEALGGIFYEKIFIHTFISLN